MKTKNLLNVIEKCLVHSERKQKEDIILEILQAKVATIDPAEDTQSRSSNTGQITLQDLMRDKYGNYVIQRIIDISTEQQKKQLIDKILKAAATMKKYKSHARHVFNYLEKNFGIQVTFIDDDASSSKKGGAGDSRKSSGAVTGGKMSSASKTSDIMEGNKYTRGAGSCLTDKPPQSSSRRGKQAPKGKGSVITNDDQASTTTGSMLPFERASDLQQQERKSSSIF